MNGPAIKNKYFDEALNHLEDIAVLSKRKEPLRSWLFSWFKGF
jgi:hypothetical protein